MRIIENKHLKEIPRVPCPIDSLKSLPYKVKPPLPAKSFALYIVGTPGSGKTNLWQSLLLSHPTRKKPNIPRFYYRYFDIVHIISGSLDTLPVKRFGLDGSQLHNQYSDELLYELIDGFKEGENTNNLIVLDDVIKDLKRSKILSKCILNRRHCTHNAEEEDHGGLSVLITSQKYTLLPLEVRNAMSHVVVFKSSNTTEIRRIKEELMADLTPQEQEGVLEMAWKEPYSFLYIDLYRPKTDKYFVKFNRIVFDPQTDL